MSLSYYKEFEISFKEIMEDIDSTLRFNLKHGNEKKFFEYLEEFLRETKDMIKGWKKYCKRFPIFYELGEIINEEEK